MKWRVRLTAKIDDEVEVEADSEQDAIDEAHEGWVFVEAHSWDATAEPEEARP